MLAEETFIVGPFAVSIENSNNYFPDVLTEENLQIFLTNCQKSYDKTFREIADISRFFSVHISDLEVQKQMIIALLECENARTIVEKSGLSYTTVNKLKRKNSNIESLNVSSFEKLYSIAGKSIHCLKVIERMNSRFC